ERPNRFIAYVEIDGRKEIAHVKNTGRCKEILLPSSEVFLQYSPSSKRKTDYSLIGAKKESKFINIDSQAPNHVVYEAILENKIEEIKNVSLLRKEVSYGSSRFDMYFEANHEKGFIEVKG